jgi:hypothetical protein
LQTRSGELRRDYFTGEKEGLYYFYIPECTKLFMLVLMKRGTKSTFSFKNVFLIVLESIYMS